MLFVLLLLLCVFCFFSVFDVVVVFGTVFVLNCFVGVYLILVLVFLRVLFVFVTKLLLCCLMLFGFDYTMLIGVVSFLPSRNAPPFYVAVLFFCVSLLSLVSLSLFMCSVCVCCCRCCVFFCV